MWFQIWSLGSSKMGCTSAWAFHLWSSTPDTAQFNSRHSGGKQIFAVQGVSFRDCLSNKDVEFLMFICGSRPVPEIQKSLQSGMCIYWGVTMKSDSTYIYKALTGLFIYFLLRFIWVPTCCLDEKCSLVGFKLPGLFREQKFFIYVD